MFQRTERPAPAWSPPAEFEWLLAHYHARDREAPRWQMVQLLLQESRWRAHWDSIQYLDAQRAAAIQDGRELSDFRPITPLCREVARAADAVFAGLAEGAAPEGATLEQWRQHANECTYCRRVSLRWLAARTKREEKVPEPEPLLVDWLLQRHYARALDAVTARLAEGMPKEGLTDLVQEDGGADVSSRFVTKVRYVTPMLLDAAMPETPPSEELIGGFVAYVQRPEVVRRMREAIHVRDVLGRILVAFLEEEGVSDAATVGDRLSPQVVENILWRLAAENRRQAVSDPREQQALEAAQESLRQGLQRGAREPAEQVAKDAIRAVAGAWPQLWEALQEEYKQASNAKKFAA